MAATYDRIGRVYARHRRTDPSVAAQIVAALGDAATVLNVGAGTGSYEPGHVDVVAVEPSAVMRAQRAEGAAPCVAAVAEALPFGAGAFDAATTVLSLHHWSDPWTGLDELARVARRQVVLTFDPEPHLDLWLMRDYVPEMLELRGSQPPTPAAIADHLGGRIEDVPIPADCRDGFLVAYWRRPEAFLDPEVRASVSGLAQLPDDLVAERMAQLAADLDDGTWARRNADLLEHDTFDGGLRLIVADAG